MLEGAELTPGIQRVIGWLKEKYPQVNWGEIENLNFEKDYQDWKERILKAVSASPPDDDFSYLNCVIIFPAINGSDFDVYTELIIGSGRDYDPFDEYGAFYGDYYPLPDESYSPGLSRIACFMEGAYEYTNDWDAGLLLLSCAFFYTDRFCKEVDTSLLLGKRGYRYIFAGFNDPIYLVGAITPKGWVKPNPGESDTGFRKRIEQKSIK